jgi:hypothetical protein
MFDSWDEAVVEFVEVDPQLAEYEAWEEAGLAAKLLILAEMLFRRTSFEEHTYMTYKLQTARPLATA